MTIDAMRASIFFSWQSDSLDATNRQFIRQQLRSAVNDVESEHSGVVIDVDEATRDLPGSPNIPAAILSKIKAADIFVCDITTINPTQNNVRKVPNPNVVYELGFAVATLGWGRVVLLFNEAIGKFPEDLPFDFDRHRASPFSASVPPTGAQKRALSNLLAVAVSKILETNPERPTAELTPAEKQHARDVDNLRWVTSTLHLPTIDQHILECPHMLADRTLHFWESFNGVMSSSHFHLYDEELLSLFRTLHSAFHDTVRFGENYHPTYSGNVYVFSSPGDAPLREAQQKAWDLIEEGRSTMKVSLYKILSCIRARFLEVDIDSASKEAWREYVEFQKSITEKLDASDT